MYQQSEKMLLSSNTSSTCPHNMVNYGPLAAEIVSLVWGTPGKFQRVWRLGSVTARHSSSGHQPNFAALNRGRCLYLAGRPSRWALAHISSSIMLCTDAQCWLETKVISVIPELWHHIHDLSADKNPTYFQKNTKQTYLHSVSEESSCSPSLSCISH